MRITLLACCLVSTLFLFACTDQEAENRAKLAEERAVAAEKRAAPTSSPQRAPRRTIAERVSDGACRHGENPAPSCPC